MGRVNKRGLIITISKALIPLVVIIFALIQPARAQYDKEKKELVIPEGMELIKEGSLNIVVPKGTKIKRERDLIIIENVSDYVARNLDDMKSQLEELSAKEEKLEDEVRKLQDIISTFISKPPASPEEKQ